MMKKLWPWIGLLLLLMILCVVTKVDTIQITQKTRALSTAATGLCRNDSRPIDFDIIQKDNAYQLNGQFRDTAQQQRLAEAFAQTHHTLHIGNTSTNQTLVAKEVIILVETIIPHFTKHYKNGRIQFHDNKLSIFGTVDSYAAKRDMERMLNSTTIPTQDNTEVILPKKPISFKISKEKDDLSLSGHFQTNEQISALSSSTTNGIRIADIVKDPSYIDPEGAIPFAQQILPIFSDQFSQGYIEYNDRQFTIHGLAKNQAVLDRMRSLLAQSRIPAIDQMRVDPAAIKKSAAEEAARKVRLKAEAEEATRLKAEAEAKATAQAKEAEQRRLIMAEKIRKEAEEAKKNIANLLKVENIEFETAKASLTPKGRQTVNKLAEILNKYPHISVEIAGHTDSDGSADFNQRLSQSRVDTVKNALIEQGIKAERLKAIGYGETKPLVPNDSRANKQKNRRVEINILGE